jgi:hypothetical protein
MSRIRLRSGFTRIELLAVLSIMVILVGLLPPTVNAAREAGRRGRCQNDMKQLGQGPRRSSTAFGYFTQAGVIGRVNPVLRRSRTTGRPARESQDDRQAARIQSKFSSTRRHPFRAFPLRAGDR